MRISKVVVIALVLGIVCCMTGCEFKHEMSEADYDRIITLHLQKHGCRVTSYDYINVYSSGAEGRAHVVVGTDFGASMEMAAKVSVAQDGSIISCSYCEWWGEP